MPLLKRKPYGLSKPPKDMKPQELVFQVRFTKEIFRDYEEYLKRINLYRQRIWTCKVTGKINLTYEEALVSECRATEKVQQFPKEFMGLVLKIVHWSTLRLDDLVNKILKTVKDCFVDGEEIVCVHENLTRRCKVIGVLASGDESDEVGNARYEIGWLDDDKNVIGTSLESADCLVRKKPPFTRALLKSFIRESVSNNAARTAPWMVHENLCCKYNLSTEPPEEVQRVLEKHNRIHKEPNGVSKRPAADEVEPLANQYKKRYKRDTDPAGGDPKSTDKGKAKKGLAVAVPIVVVPPISYPIDDSLVQPSPDDPPFEKRPVPSTDFPLPMECIGRLMMVWNFCLLFGKAIHLYPFSLDEFEKALECKDGDPILLREAHYALVQSTISDAGMEQLLSHKRKRKVKLSIQTWKDDLADILELQGLEKLAELSPMIRQGSYRLLEPSVKLDILCELVDLSLTSPTIRDQLDLYIEEKRAIAAQKRKEDVEQVKKGKEVQEHLKQVETSETMKTNMKLHFEDGDFDMATDVEENSSETNDGSNGTCANGELDDDSTLASCQSTLKQKSASKQAEEKDKEIRKIDEEKEKRKLQAAVLRERKMQEKKLVELQKRKEQLEREIEKRVIRTNPLGRDRDYNRYWFFPREGRIFVEDQESTKWGYYSAKEELEALYGSLNSKGTRERALQRQLEKQFNKISDALQKRSKDIAQKLAVEDASIRRSSRVKSSPHQANLVVYKNKYRNP